MKVVSKYVLFFAISLFIFIPLSKIKVCYGEKIELEPSRPERLKEKADCLYCIVLYSKISNIKQGEEKRKFLETGYKYIKNINEGIKELEILKEKSLVLKAVMKDEGVSSIKAYYDVLSEINKYQNIIIEADRNFEAMVRKWS